MQEFVKDCQLWPVSGGQLLLSASRGLFCGLDLSEAVMVREILEGRQVEVKGRLEERLRGHGFFDLPRDAHRSRSLVQFQLTNACPLKCCYCSVSSGCARDCELSYEEVRCCVRESMGYYGKDVQFCLSGGEPFLREWVLDIVDEILREGYEVSVLSNGLPLYEDEVLRRCVAVRMSKGMCLHLSFSGVSVERCDFLSGGKCFESQIQVVKALKELGVKPNIDLLLNSQDVESILRDFGDFREAIGSDLCLNVGMMYLGGREKGEHLFKDYESYDDLLDGLCFGYGEKIDGSVPCFIAPLRDGCECVEGNQVFVRSDGEIYGCFRMVECMGHIRDGFLNVLKRMEDSPKPAFLLDYCKACPLVRLCGGGCRAENKIMTGDADRPYCGEWRVRVLMELLFEDKVYALQWPGHFLFAEAKKRKIV